MTTKRWIWIALVMALWSRTSSAQDLAGDWQGTLSGVRPLRLIVHVQRGDGSAWKATMSSVDQSPDWGAALPVDSLVVQGASFKLAMTAVRGTFDGTISSDGNSIVGTWSQATNQSPLTFARVTRESAWKDPAPHSIRFVNIDPDVKIEVIDWGGPSNANSRTLVLVPGLGNTAHVFDALAPKLVGRYHVVGVTRRGFGASSAPASGYTADRLGDDVLAVMEALGVSKPVLVGHSLGGEELSSIGSRYPEKVAGLIYLDAGYSYAFYAPGIDPIPPPPAPDAPLSPVIRAILDGMQQYTKVSAPILAIYAIPQDPPTASAASRAMFDENNRKGDAQAKAFAEGLPTARVVRIPHANHYVFLSNEMDVIRELDAFVGELH